MTVVLCSGAMAANTNSLAWHANTGRVDADIQSWTLDQLLQRIALETGWKVYEEPGLSKTVSSKFKSLPSGEALKMLLGELNFALVSQTNAPAQFYVFRTVMENATRRIQGKTANAPAKHVANELLLRLKPGTDVDALAKMLGAKITGRNDKLGIYRFQFADEAATEAALGKLAGDSDVTAVDYNYYFDRPTAPVAVTSASAAPLSLQLNPSSDSGKLIVGMLDTHAGFLGADLDKFVLKGISVAGDAAGDGQITHGTAMEYTILNAISQASGGKTSAQILPVDVFGPNEMTTSWDVALGIQAAVNNGATVINLSLGSSGESTILDTVIQQALGDGIMFFAAAGNVPVNTPTYPAAVNGVYSVTALAQQGQLAPYANFWPGDYFALPGTSLVPYANKTWVVQGTSPATAYATGVYAGTMGIGNMTRQQIIQAMQQKFAVPKK